MKAFNYSALSTAYKCQMQFKHLYIDKLKQETPDSADMKFGSAIHLALETMLKGEEGWELDFTYFWDSEKNRNNTYTRYNWAELQDQGLLLLNRFKKLHLKKFKPVAIEQKMTGKLKEVELFGTPDFVGDFEGVPSIVDFKTAAYRYPKEKLNTTEQMFLYTELVRQNISFKAKQVVYIVFIKGREPGIQTIQRDISDCDLKYALDNIYLQTQQLQGIIKQENYTKNYNGCFCPFPSKCFPHLNLANKE